jgi:translocation and assembly module TamB
VTFDARAIRFDELTAKVGGGDVQFGGRVGLQGYKPGDLNVTAVGTNMRLRYPEGVTSLVDADLSLRGSFDAPLLTGTVTVKDAVWTKRIDTSSLHTARS